MDMLNTVLIVDKIIEDKIRVLMFCIIIKVWGWLTYRILVPSLRIVNFYYMTLFSYLTMDHFSLIKLIREIGSIQSQTLSYICNEH